MLLFLAAPFGVLFLGMAARTAGVLDTEEAIRARTEEWRGKAAPAAAAAGVPLDLLLGLVATESSGRPGATSRAGAVGLTQLMPATGRGLAAEAGLPSPSTADLRDPDLNLRLGARYLADQLETFRGDPALALAAYNAGPGRAMEWRRREPTREGIDLVRAHAGPETRAYVERVLARRRWFREPPAPAPQDTPATR
jgi:soluble lytic murein transglycosylase